MSALARRTAACNIDYVSGVQMPKGESAADIFLESLSLISELDTLTGETPGYRRPDELAAAMREMDAMNARSVLDILNDTKTEGTSRRIGPRSSFEPLQEWEGYVLEVNEHSFIARLLDLTKNSPFEQEEAEFQLEDVSLDDRNLLAEGAIFRWAIGYETRLGGTRRKVSTIAFRRLPIWRASDIAEARSQARDYLDNIDWR